MMGPETTTGASAEGAEGAAAAGEAVAAGGVAALTVDVGAAEPLSPQAASERIATAAPQQRIKLRILIRPNPFLPTEPIPNFAVQPKRRLAENHVGRGIPADANFAAAFHSGANGTIVIAQSDASVKDGRFANDFASGTDHLHVTIKVAGRITVEFDDGFLAAFEQAGFGVVDGDVDGGLGGVDDFGEGVALNEFAADKIFDVGSGDDAVDRRAQLSAIHGLGGAIDFGFPEVGLDAVDAGLAAVIGGEGAIHFQHGGFVAGAGFGKRRAKIPGFHFCEHFAALDLLAFVDEDFANHAFDLRLNKSAAAWGHHGIAIDAKRQ